MHRLPVRACALAMLFLQAAFALSGCAAPQAGESRRVALVRRGPSRMVQQACVRLRERIRNGEQVLLDSGWQVRLDAGHPMGSIVCAIDGQGCRFPSEDCFRPYSQLGSCSHWASFAQGADGQWAFSLLGARAQPAVDGDVHAWIWVTGTRPEPGAQPALLPAVTFDGVCPPGQRLPCALRLIYNFPSGAVAELADAGDLKSLEGDLVWVRLPPAPLEVAHRLTEAAERGDAMRNPKWIWILTACLAVTIPACTLPGMTAPTPIVLPTPNATLTAIFEPTATGTPALVPTLAPPSATPTALSATLPPATAATLDASRLRPNGTPVLAVRLASPPTIDGDLGEWSSTVYAASQIVFGSSNWTGTSDGSGSYYIGWDAGALYLAVGVRDDAHVQRATGAKLYLGDDVELQLDVNLVGDFSSTTLSSDDVQLGLSAGDFAGRAPEAYRWYPSSLAGRPSGVTVQAKPTADGYVLEAQIPWSVLGATPEEGQAYGFALSLSDNDRSGTSVQQSMVSSVATRKLLNPTTWGTLVLEGSAAK